MYSERRAFMPIYFSVRQKFSGHTPVKNQLQLIFSGETLAHVVKTEQAVTFCCSTKSNQKGNQGGQRRTGNPG
jgi:hypothetical protein